MLKTIVCSLVGVAHASASQLSYTPLMTAAVPSKYNINAQKPLLFNLNYPAANAIAANNNLLAPGSYAIGNAAMNNSVGGPAANLQGVLSPPLVAAGAMNPAHFLQRQAAYGPVNSVPMLNANSMAAAGGALQTPLYNNNAMVMANAPLAPTAGKPTKNFTPDEELKIKKLVQDIQELVAQAANKEGMTITLETHLEHDLEMDSLAKMDLLLEIEKKHDVTLSEDESGDVATVGHIVDHVKSKKQLA